MAEGLMRSPRVVGRYVLYGELAAGGMATVHFGRLSGPIGFSRTVAIKRLHPHFAKDPEFVTMFLDEARLCGRIRHPNVVSTLDVVTQQGELFIVMEYVPGEALSKLLKSANAKNVVMPPKVAATILSSVLHGLHAAHQTRDEQGHELGIVHRDVSPQNILVGADGSARVLDFGVAKATGRLQTTRDGQLKGKIAYMPPEQLSGANVTQQIDVYAAAVVFWEALAGRRLYEGETEAVVLARVIDGKVEPPSVHRPGIPPEVDALVMRGLSRDPATRFATAREMAVAIEQTVGLASPSEVGAWVESVANEELTRRAETIAAIEVAALDAPALEPALAGPPDSQVSSISVARPAFVAKPIARRLPLIMFGVFGLLAGAGIWLGTIALQSGEAGTPRAASRLEQEPKRRLSVLLPPSTIHIVAPKDAAPEPAPAPVRPTVRPTAAPAPAPADAKPNCDPAYTIDPASGRKSYKRECL